MIEFVLVALAVIGFVVWSGKEQRRKEEAADSTFRITMLALEEKAKREGTFKISYFDKEKK